MLLNAMLLSVGQKHISNIDCSIKNVVILRVNSRPIRDLGIIIDSNLKFSHCIIDITNKAFVLY